MSLWKYKRATPDDGSQLNPEGILEVKLTKIIYPNTTDSQG
jgi:hypothetical protein